MLRRRVRCLLAILTVGALACSKSEPAATGVGTSSGSAIGGGSGSAAREPTCEQLGFATTTPVPEASGAAWLEIDGKLALVVISDSGNDGAYGVVDPETGETRETGKLPHGGGGSDLEGIAVRGGHLHVITSPGWIHTYARVAGGFELVDKPYPLGPIDLAGKGGGLGDQPPKGSGMVCAANATNCGRNYEGLCLAPAGSTGGCIGFAASKADGHLYCVVEEGGKLVVQYANAIRIARPGVVADCAFTDDGRLLVGSNLFDAGTVYRVGDWQDVATAKVEKLANLAIGFPETIAARADVIYRMSDTGSTAPSLMAKYRCGLPTP